ncbi:unnamed protein product [Linum tenue]|uniref:Uncharacterized protein n=1 Tax=Linum tenue TaxID=586396 RepID=A0AAV0JH02_9ROSI|nr:unnamed protein product [Linum tenue]
MEVAVKSVENVKPSCPSQLKPFKLCLLDQMMGRGYIGLVLFYPPTPADGEKETVEAGGGDQKVEKLKASLSKTLNSFYPLAGRVKDNARVEDFEAGVPFVVSRVKGYDTVSEFLKSPNLEVLNKFLPVEPFCLPNAHHVPLLPPPLLVQVNTFDCGGVAVGLCLNHKLADGVATSSFLRSWSAHCNHNNNTNHDHDSIITSQGSSVFPPRESMPPHVERLHDKMFLEEGKNTATRRFVFDANAVASIKADARTSCQVLENPSRTEAMLAFIWKSIMTAAISTSPSPPPPSQFLMQPVNVRPRMNLSEECFGNLFCMAMAYSSDPPNQQVGELAQLIRAGVSMVDHKFLKALSSDDGFEAMVEMLNQLSEVSQPQMLCGSSWLRFCFDEVDFGWGKPAWTGVLGEASADYPSYSNLIILKEHLAHRQDAAGVEAWIRLDVDVMATLEHDPHFLQFASPNPPIFCSSS